MELLINSLIIFGAKYLLILIIGIAFIYFLKQSRNKQKQLVVFGIITCALAFVTARIATQCYYDARPFVTGHFMPLIPHDSDNGFPSDHTLLASAVAMVIFYFNRKMGMVLLALAVLVGTARVMAGVHHPIDIIGSIIISVGVSFVIRRAIMPIINNSKIYTRYFN